MRSNTGGGCNNGGGCHGKGSGENRGAGGSWSGDHLCSS